MKKIKDLLLKNKVFVIVALILLIAIAVLVGVNVHKNNVVKKEQEAIKETVEKYIAAFNDLDADKMFETIDPKAGYAWSQLDGTTSEKEGKFKEQLDKTTDTEAESYKNNLKSEINVMKTVYSKYLENYKVELTNLEKHEKVDGVEGLIKVKAETKTSYTYDGKEDSTTGKVLLYLYNGKIVTMEDTKEENTTEENTTSEENKTEEKATNETNNKEKEDKKENK